MGERTFWRMPMSRYLVHSTGLFAALCLALAVSGESGEKQNSSGVTVSERLLTVRQHISHLQKGREKNNLKVTQFWRNCFSGYWRNC
jgi:hypothetical protein